MELKTKKTKHSVYNLNYHIVFVTKYRHKVFNNGIDEFVKEQIQLICCQYGWEQLALEVMPEHIHVFVSAPPTTAPNTICKTIKSILTIKVFKEYKTLKQKYFWGSGLFSDGAYYGSAGNISADTIKKYIEEQKNC